jgi:hypothetical protein
MAPGVAANVPAAHGTHGALPVGLLEPGEQVWANAGAANARAEANRMSARRMIEISS